MDLNELLRVCDYRDVRARAMLLDELHQAGRYEEEELIGYAGRDVQWDDVCGLVLQTVANQVEGDVNCPYCLHSPPEPFHLWATVCEHTLVWGMTRHGGIDFNIPGSIDYLAPSVRQIVEDLLRGPVGSGFSPVLCTQQIGKGGDAEETSLSVRSDVYDLDETGDVVADDETVTARVLYIWNPVAFIDRLANLARQRKAAGCPIPPADAYRAA